MIVHHSMRNVFLSLILFFFSIIGANAQNEPYRAEIGFQVGANVYTGDVNTIADLASFGSNISNIRPALGATFRYRFNRRLAARVGYDCAEVKGKYRYVDENNTHYALLNNELHVVDLCGEYNFFDLEKNPYKRFSKRFSPYIFAGLGGIITPQYKSIESNSILSGSIPFGLGVKIKLGERLNLTIRYTNRLVLNDNLEGINKFENPSPKTVSNIMNNDLLTGFSIGLTCDFWRQGCDCPQVDIGKSPKAHKSVKRKNEKRKSK